MSRIIKLTAENVKRLRAVDITPIGAVITIGGRNGQGKTSVLDSIAMALGGADEKPDMPVRQGAEKAKIVLELDDLIIRRTFTAAGGTSLIVENKDGARYPKPQDMLDRLSGKLTFDPLEFIRINPAKQAEALKKLVGLDFTALETKRKALYDERTLVNRQAEQAKSKADFMPHHDDAPAEESSVTAIVAERDAAKEHNGKRRDVDQRYDDALSSLADAKQGRQSVADEIAHVEARLVSLRQQLAEYNTTVPAIETRVSSAKAEVESFKAIDVSPINLRLAGAEQVNVKVRQNKAHADALREVVAIESKALGLTQQIDAIDEDKSKQLAAAKFPVDGLSFNESAVLFRGIPFSQASGAEKLRVSLAMASALNPKLPVMLIRDGSLLDDESMALVATFAAEHNLQVWIERVGDDDKSAIIIEDGAVSVAAAEPVLATD